LDALFAGSVLPKEVIIVDQGSSDAAQKLVELRKRENREPLIYIHQPPKGLSASRNAGISCAASPIVAVTDDDCVPGTGWVEAVEQAFASSDFVQAVTGRMLPLGPETPGLHAASSRTSMERRDFHGKEIPMLIGTGGNFAVKREWFFRAGGYDERLGAGSAGKAAEDIDFYYRLLHIGVNIRYEPEAVVFHQQHSLEKYTASRWTYGFGIGAFCGIWFSRRDAYTARILSFWLRFQGRALLSALLRRDWSRARLTSRLLTGTASGLIYGLRAAPLGVDNIGLQKNDDKSS